MPWIDGPVDPDLGDPDDADGLAGGRRGRRERGRGRRACRCAGPWRLSPGQLLGELGLEPVLLAGLVEAGAPELVGDEQQDQDPDRDEGASDARR